MARGAGRKARASALEGKGWSAVLGGARQESEARATQRLSPGRSLFVLGILAGTDHRLHQGDQVFCAADRRLRCACAAASSSLSPPDTAPRASAARPSRSSDAAPRRLARGRRRVGRPPEPSPARSELRRESAPATPRSQSSPRSLSRPRPGLRHASARPSCTPIEPPPPAPPVSRETHYRGPTDLTSPESSALVVSRRNRVRDRPISLAPARRRSNARANFLRPSRAAVVCPTGGTWTSVRCKGPAEEERRRA